jgi:hypothetical protein
VEPDLHEAEHDEDPERRVEEAIEDREVDARLGGRGEGGAVAPLLKRLQAKGTHGRTHLAREEGECDNDSERDAKGDEDDVSVVEA